jgi:hypothetical protein
MSRSFHISRGKRTRRLFCGVLLTVVALAPPAMSASESAASLAERQAAVQTRMKRLEERMVKLARLLASIEPDKARRLEQALESAGKQRLRQQLENAALLLRDQALGEADFRQQQILADLNALLQTLNSTQPDLDRLRSTREWLAALRERLDATIAEQTQQRTALEQQLAASQLAENLSDTAAELDALAERQQALRAASQSDDAARQNQRTLTRDIADARGRVEQAVQQATDVRTRNALQRAAQSATQAEEHAQQAADTLPREPGVAAQAEAQQALEQAAETLREISDRLAEQEVKRLADRQSALQEQTRDLHRAMQRDAEGSLPAPGREQVGEAGNNMQQAAQDLRADDADAAAQAQDAALAELARAREQLAERLAQVREEERIETLSNVATRIEALLTQERVIREALGKLAPTPAHQWTVAQQELLLETSERHLRVIADARALLRLLRDEGTTIVLPDLVALLLRDLEEGSTSLVARDVSQPTLDLFDEIVLQLEQMLAAVQQEQDAAQSDQNGEQTPSRPQSGQSDQQPLMERSAEFRLLRMTQERINARTERLAEAAPEEDPFLPDRFDQVGRRQAELAELTAGIMERDQL